MKKKGISGDIEKCLNEKKFTSKSTYSKLYVKCMIINYIVLISAFVLLAYMYLEQSRLLAFLITNSSSEVYIAYSPPVIEVIFLLLLVAVLISLVGMLYIRRYLIVKYISIPEKEADL